MSALFAQPWPYAVIIMALLLGLTALLLGRRLKFWGWGFGMEVNHTPDHGPERGSNAERLPMPPKPAPRRTAGKARKPKRRKK